ncbi:MAG: diaminopimelate epimerase [Clostridiales bacterium]|jgi:diaminopimelate epimerase|nr:diaminopimelate epimerase [Clostridiales bacterium]
MKYNFIKMQGCGNDYIYFDCRGRAFPSLEDAATVAAAIVAEAARLSDRHFGIGGDGIVLILPSQTADARMRMFNADGSEGRMCGNAIRCVGKYLYENGAAKKNSVTVETLSGVKRLDILAEKGRAVSVRVDMGRAELDPAKIPALLEGPSVISRPVLVDGERYSVTCVSMGNPHAVIFAEDVTGLPLAEIGPRFQQYPAFPEGVNTEFVRVINSRALQMRVWERGSGETLACGTGACASVVAAVLNGYCPMEKDIVVHLLGGQLTIRYTEETVFMTGGCETVFEGAIDIE